VQCSGMEWSKLGGESENCCGSVVASCCCEKLVDEARGQFGNPEEGERPPLKPLPGNDYPIVTCSYDL
jgi:hypothetical protein